LAGKRAELKGFNFWPYFAFSLISWPFTALITQHVLDKAADEKEAEAQREKPPLVR
jgi:hypothetical protein